MREVTKMQKEIDYKKAKNDNQREEVKQHTGLFSFETGSVSVGNESKPGASIAPKPAMGGIFGKASNDEKLDLSLLMK